MQNFYAYCTTQVAYNSRLRSGGVVNAEGEVIILADGDPIDQCCEKYCLGNMSIPDFIAKSNEIGDAVAVPGTKLSDDDLSKLYLWLDLKMGTCSDFLCRMKCCDIFSPIAANSDDVRITTVCISQNIRFKNFLGRNDTNFLLGEPVIFVTEDFDEDPYCGLCEAGYTALCTMDKSAATGKSGKRRRRVIAGEIVKK